MTEARPVTIERHPDWSDWEAYCHVHQVRMLADSHADVYEMAAGHLTMHHKRHVRSLPVFIWPATYTTYTLGGAA